MLKRKGLHYLTLGATKASQVYFSKIVDKKEKGIWLPHYIFGHPNFVSLKLLFPQLFVDFVKREKRENP